MPFRLWAFLSKSEVGGGGVTVLELRFYLESLGVKANDMPVTMMVEFPQPDGSIIQYDDIPVQDVAKAKDRVVLIYEVLRDKK